VKVAVLGATSQIAQGLIEELVVEGIHDLVLFARDLARVRDQLGLLPSHCGVRLALFKDFADGDYDVVVNCVGFGTPQKIAAAGSLIFGLTQEFDDLVLAYLDLHPGCRYVNFSSGAVYGTDFPQPVQGIDFENRLKPASLRPEHFYGLAKLHSEARHRARPDLWIVDLRVFSYFSKYIDLQGGFLMSSIVRTLKANTPFMTGNQVLVRDFVVPSDLAALVSLCLAQEHLNAGFDVYSAGAVSKSELLDWLQVTYGLKVEFIDGNFGSSPTGSKENYYSVAHEAAALGYRPRFNSIQGIARELTAMGLSPQER
jgi:nucleoside-diphosphate-sugar epimerase